MGKDIETIFMQTNRKSSSDRSKSATVKSGAISVSSNGTKHLSIVDMLKTEEGKNRLINLSSELSRLR